ncbi:IS66 family transposase [Armatimonas sp.]|uniref:IS66 family transposase n=1 Tax=Armatimonas sp. TaxID=1872638 RepID=UPI00374D4CE1
MKTISNEMVIAYWWCHRKAYLLSAEPQPSTHPYLTHLNRMRDRARAEVKSQHSGVMSSLQFDPTSGATVFVNPILKSGDLEASCDLLTRVPDTSHTDRFVYEPTLIGGTYHVTTDQKLELAFVGYVLGQLQHKVSATGIVVSANGQAHRVRLGDLYGKVETILNALRESVLVLQPPPAFLIDHCTCCPFRTSCLESAQKEDSLSLLSRMTPKIARAYQKKGIFTVNQLSYTFRPRRSRKPRPNAAVHFKFELQALALRTAQIYVQRLPELPKRSVELFLDIEGIPDQGFDYLVGILVIEDDKSSYHYFWAQSREDELAMWQQALALMSGYPDAPIYHYGSYEAKAIDRLTRVHQVDCVSVKARLLNVNSIIYGRIYFPTRSNGLKDLAKLLGFEWTSSDATGLQSLVWRQQWEDTRSDEYKETLVTYNHEDCQALQVLTKALRRIGDKSDSQTNVEFAGAPSRKATATGNLIHRQFDAILNSAHADYNGKKISFKEAAEGEQAPPKKRGGPIGRTGFCRAVPKPTRVIHLDPVETCPSCPEVSLKPSKRTFARMIIDLVFTKTGCRKTITKYTGIIRYCPSCHRQHPPKITGTAFDRDRKCLFGRSLQAWAIYQRIVLRLSYRLITEMILEQFNESVSPGTLTRIIKDFGSLYSETEKINVQHLLRSPVIHADETKINIQGTEEFVWVFTDGQHVVFRLTETRESDIAHEFLEGYQGVLISDFYAGYDGIACRQQKCLVHLIRDLNNDLWSAPFDREFEMFVAAVKDLLSPILEAVRKYGLKARHLRKFEADVAKFYEKFINGTSSRNELVVKYQKRFQRYEESLFLFISVDDVPWHNNRAENGIRPLAVQRKISGTFFKDVAPSYLLLLGISQTCKYKDKSFLRFLLSEEVDIAAFKPSKRMKTSSVKL